uniref:Uncharacterized protein n=1 Tax=Opuntia streptacantha TaxID=393608 RepID=A0A7C9EQA0_OPUST
MMHLDSKIQLQELRPRWGPCTICLGIIMNHIIPLRVLLQNSGQVGRKSLPILGQFLIKWGLLVSNAMLSSRLQNCSRKPGAFWRKNMVHIILKHLVYIVILLELMMQWEGWMML